MLPLNFQTRMLAPVAVCAVLFFGQALAQAPKDSAEKPAAHDTAMPQTVLPAAGMDTLAGPLPDTVRAGNRPHLVVGDIEVPVGRTVTVEAGSVFLFKNFTGLHVQGKLVAQGTKEQPVIFTSENDRARNPATQLYPNPYDWNGVYLHPDATGTIMSYCTVCYSVYGIVSETKFIRLDRVTFLQNGKSNLVVDGKAQAVTDAPYIYILSTDDVKAQGVPVKILSDPHAARRNVVRYTGFAVLLGAAAGSAYYGVQWKNAQAGLSALSTDDQAVLKGRTEPEWFSLHSKRNTDQGFTLVGAGIAIIGLAGFCWTFTF
jgi:hypothetical protein